MTRRSSTDLRTVVVLTVVAVIALLLGLAVALAYGGVVSGW